MLEALECTKIEAKVLLCDCEKKMPDNTLGQFFFPHWFISGPKGEFYELTPPFKNTKCDDRAALVISRVLFQHLNGPVQLPLLWGIKKIYREVVLKRRTTI